MADVNENVFLKAGDPATYPRRHEALGSFATQVPGQNWHIFGCQFAQVSPNAVQLADSSEHGIKVNTDDAEQHDGYLYNGEA